MLCFSLSPCGRVRPNSQLPALAPHYCCSYGSNFNTISHLALLLVFVALSGLAATFAVLFVARRILYPHTHTHTHSLCLSVCAGVSKCRFAGVTFTVYATLAPHVLSTKTSITFSPGLGPSSVPSQLKLGWYYTYSPWTRRWCASPAWMVLMAKVFLQNRIESNNQGIINYAKINKTSF